MKAARALDTASIPGQRKQGRRAYQPDPGFPRFSLRARLGILTRRFGGLPPSGQRGLRGAGPEGPGREPPRCPPPVPPAPVTRKKRIRPQKPYTMIHEESRQLAAPISAESGEDPPPLAAVNEPGLRDELVITVSPNVL